MAATLQNLTVAIENNIPHNMLQEFQGNPRRQVESLLGTAGANASKVRRDFLGSPWFCLAKQEVEVLGGFLAWKEVRWKSSEKQPVIKFLKEN